MDAPASPGRAGSSASRARVLVAAELADFLERTEVPDGVQVELVAAGSEPPRGEHVGLLWLLTRPLGAEQMERLPRLRVIANFGVGYDNVEVDAARARGIAVSNTPDVLTGSTAELTWTLILATARRLTEAQELARGGEWEGWAPTQLLGMGLEGRTLGIVGAGRIGQEVGRRARAFGMGVLYWGRAPHPEWEAETGAARVPLEELLERSDVVSVHVALTPSTRHLIDAAALARMRPGAVLVNTARGPIVDEEALIAALESGRLGGAGLDVYEDEPRIPERLRRLKNAVLLPHVGSATADTRRRMWELAWRNLLRGVRGEPLLTPVGPPPDAPPPERG